MRQILLSLLFFAFSNLSAQDIETIKIPEGVVYKYSDNKIIDRAKKLIKDNISNNNKYSILQDHLIIGPELWKRFKKIEQLAKIKGNVEFHVDDEVLAGKMSQSISDAKLILNEFRNEITGEYKIRKANEQELKYYWSVISFDIEEPLLIVETKEHNYILNLLKSNFKLLWIDEAPLLNNDLNLNNASNSGFTAYKNGKEVTSTSIGIKETKLERVVLLDNDEHLKANTSLEDISLILERTELIFDELFSKSDKSGKILIKFELKSDTNEIQFLVKDDIDLEIMKEFEKRVNDTKFPNSKKDPIKFQLLFKVNSFDDK